MDRSVVRRRQAATSCCHSQHEPNPSTHTGDVLGLAGQECCQVLKTLQPQSSAFCKVVVSGSHGWRKTNGFKSSAMLGTSLRHCACQSLHVFTTAQQHRTDSSGIADERKMPESRCQCESRCWRQRAGCQPVGPLGDRGHASFALAVAAARIAVCPAFRMTDVPRACRRRAR